MNRRPAGQSRRKNRARSQCSNASPVHAAPEWLLTKASQPTHQPVTISWASARSRAAGSAAILAAPRQPAAMPEAARTGRSQYPQRGNPAVKTAQATAHAATSERPAPATRLSAGPSRNRSTRGRETPNVTPRTRAMQASASAIMGWGGLRAQHTGPEGNNLLAAHLRRGVSCGPRWPVYAPNREAGTGHARGGAPVGRAPRDRPGGGRRVPGHPRRPLHLRRPRLGRREHFGPGAGGPRRRAVGARGRPGPRPAGPQPLAGPEPRPGRRAAVGLPPREHRDPRRGGLRPVRRGRPDAGAPAGTVPVRARPGASRVRARAPLGGAPAPDRGRDLREPAVGVAHGALLPPDALLLHQGRAG